MEKREQRPGRKVEMTEPAKREMVIPKEKITEFTEMAKVEYPLKPGCCRNESKVIDGLRKRRVFRLMQLYIKENK